MKLKTHDGIEFEVDDEDFERVLLEKWYVDTSNGYVKTSTTKIYLHRFIMNTPKGLQTDHINQNKLDNRKSNLRVCTLHQNRSNTKLYKNNKSGYRGVIRQGDKWTAEITVNGNPMRLGSYQSIVEAARAYNGAARKYHGEFATENVL